jgi:hypothetical protein
MPDLIHSSTPDPDLPGVPLEAAWKQVPPEWRTLRWPITSPPFREVFVQSPKRQLAGDILELDLRAFPDRVGQEVAWYVWRSWRDGYRKVDPLMLIFWVETATEWQHRRRTASQPMAASVLDMPPQEIERLRTEMFYRRYGRLPLLATSRHFSYTARPLFRTVDIWLSGKAWWEHDVWSLVHDPRIPRRELEPRVEQGIPVGSYSPIWLREGMRYWLRTRLTYQILTWGSVRSYAVHLGHCFGGFVTRWGITSPALVDSPERQLRGLMLDYLDELKTRPSLQTKRLLSPTSYMTAQAVVSHFYRFAYDHRFELAETTGDERWTLLTPHHTRLWPEELAPGRRLRRGRHQAENMTYISDADLSRMVAGIEWSACPAVTSTTSRSAARSPVHTGWATRKACESG